MCGPLSGFTGIVASDLEVAATHLEEGFKPKKVERQGAFEIFPLCLSDSPPLAMTEWRSAVPEDALKQMSLADDGAPESTSFSFTVGEVEINDTYFHSLDPG